MVIAVRTLRLVASSGQTVDVRVEIDAPEDRSDHWSCGFRIGWPDGEVTNEGKGADSVQALFGALQFIGLLLYSSDHHQQGRLYWGSPGFGHGFPVPSGARDLLVGEDAKRQY